jgi:CheY-like chemotaxis protein
VAASHFNLAVVDLGLTEPDGATVARRLREAQPDLRLVLIPLVGETLPPEVADLSTQGVLPKPFFLPELAGRIAAARRASFQPVVRPSPSVTDPFAAAPLSAATAVPEAAVRPAALADSVFSAPVEPTRGVEERRLLDADNPELSRRMTTLAREIHAQVVILTQGRHLLAAVGQLSADDTDGLVQAVAESWHTSARIAQILGREQLRFEQSIEGGEYMFYSLAIADDVILSAALRADVPLGMIRHRAKQATDALRSLLGV